MPQPRGRCSLKSPLIPRPSWFPLSPFFTSSTGFQSEGCACQKLAFTCQWKPSKINSGHSELGDQKQGLDILGVDLRAGMPSCPLKSPYWKPPGPHSLFWPYRGKAQVVQVREMFSLSECSKCKIPLQVVFILSTCLYDILAPVDCVVENSPQTDRVVSNKQSRYTQPCIITGCLCWTFSAIKN